MAKHSRKNVQLLIIDPQFDFCDPTGALYVQGADKDMLRLAQLIESKYKMIDDIHVTMDSHYQFDIAHPIAWVDKNGVNPNFFTEITLKDVENGIWKASHPALQNRWMDYVRKLNLNGRYPLCIWPPHCLIGSPGHNIDKNVYKALQKWETFEIGNMVDYVTKGSNPFCEHYSGVQAEVPDDTDPTTQLNTRLISTIQTADEIWVSGEALSHCLANTIRDIANNFGKDNIQKFLLFLDTTSSVTNFEHLSQKFLDEMKALGMRTANSTDLI